MSQSKTKAERKDALERALLAVQSGILNANEAATRFGVPRSTLYDRAKGKQPRVKAQAKSQLLSPEQVRAHH